MREYGLCLTEPVRPELGGVALSDCCAVKILPLELLPVGVKVVLTEVVSVEVVGVVLRGDLKAAWTLEEEAESLRRGGLKEVVLWAGPLAGVVTAPVRGSWPAVDVEEGNISRPAALSSWPLIMSTHF